MRPLSALFWTDGPKQLRLLLYGFGTELSRTRETHILEISHIDPYFPRFTDTPDIYDQRRDIDRYNEKNHQLSITGFSL